MRVILPQESNPALREICQSVPVSEISGPRIQGLIAQMKALLDKEEYGVALAAPQVGETLRLFIVRGLALARYAEHEGGESVESKHAPPPPDPSRRKQAEADQIYINPEFIKLSRTKGAKHEGCLSIRGKWGTVVRSEKATIRAYDERGKRCTRGASGFLAHIFQHEMDHLDGILYTDKAKEIHDEEEKE